MTGNGYSGSTSESDFATAAYDASTGGALWIRRYNGEANYGDDARALAVSPDGSKVFVTGPSYGRQSQSDYATLAYDATTGEALWVRRYNGAANDVDVPLAVGVDPDGSTVFVTGASIGSIQADYATAAYDASTGDPLWVRRYDGTASSGDTAWALGVSPDGSTVLVTGASIGSTTSSDYATVAYDTATGDPLWVGLYNGPANSHDTARALAVSLDGSTVFVTGGSSASTTSAEYATVAYSLN